MHGQELYNYHRGHYETPDPDRWDYLPKHVQDMYNWLCQEQHLHAHGCEGNCYPDVDLETATHYRDTSIIRTEEREKIIKYLDHRCHGCHPELVKAIKEGKHLEAWWVDKRIRHLEHWKPHGMPKKRQKRPPTTT